MNEIMTIGGVSCYEKDGTAYLNLEAVAKGLGFTEKKGDVEYVMWRRVDGYLAQLGFGTSAERPKYIPENIFYRLAMKAKNETAERFQALVADEIIPSIRKHGGYIVGQEEMSDTELIAKALLVADRKIKESEQKLQHLTAQTEEMRPKALFADSVAAAGTSILVRELAKLIRQNGINIGEKRLFQWMRDNGYLIKRKGTDYNMPSQKSMELKLFQIKETVINHSDGHTSVNKTVKVTGKGQQYFINKFLGGQENKV